jgi:hypothetical protein
VAAAVTFHVERLSVVTRALGAADAQLKREGTQELADLGGLVEHRAESMARAVIPNTARPTVSGAPWSEMRTGITPRVVYVVPVNKGVRGRGPRARPNFAVIMKRRAMLPALESSRPEVLRRYKALVGRVCGAFNA